MKNKWNLRIVIRAEKIRPDGTVPLYWEASINKQEMKFSSQKWVALKYWDNNKKLVKKGCGYSAVMNGYIKKTFEDFESYMIELDNAGGLISKKKVQDFFRGEHKITFYEFFEKTIKMWEGDKKQSTLNSYINTLKIMRLMEPELNFEDINYELVQRWDYYLKTVRKNTINGRFNRHKCLKAIIKETILQGHLAQTPYIHFKVRQQESKRNFLTIDEVKMLRRLRLPRERHKLQRSLDMFLFACFTGLRYSDVVRLTWAHLEINKEWTDGIMTIEMQKTSKEVQTVLIPPALEILKRYQNRQEEAVFPYITDTALNRNVKVIMDMVGIGKHITFHCARHSFASNHLEIDTPIANLKDLLGHSSIDQTQIYAKTLRKSLVKSMKNLGSIYATEQGEAA